MNINYSNAISSSRFLFRYGRDLWVSTLQEIKTAIGRLNAHDKALLAAELFATNTEPDDKELNDALQRGLADVEAGRVRPIEEVKGMIPRWTSKS